MLRHVLTLRDRRTSLATLTALALACCALAVSTAQSAAAAKAPCPQYELIGARGSGQKANADEQRMGPEIYDFLKRLSLALPGTELRGYGVQYAAVSVVEKFPTLAGSQALLHVGGAYTNSVREGRDDTLLAFHTTHTRCPDARFVLAGYSQGAQAIGDALARMSTAERGLVAAVVFFGDPFFKADSWSARTTDPSRYGIFGPRPEWPEDLHGKAFSYCHAHDPVCGLSTRHDVPGGGALYVRDPLGIDKAQHVTPAYIDQGDTARAVGEVAQALGQRLVAEPYRGPLDIAFVIDSTGSMVDEIGAVQQNVGQLVSRIGAIDPDFRVALVDYKDEPAEDSDYQSRLDVDFTTDVNAFSAALNSLVATGGGDTPESVYSGIMTALGLGWRAGAKKLVIQIGDAAAKDPEPLTGYTLESVRQRALAVDPASVDAVQTGTSTDAQSSLTAIAGATAGTYLQLPDATDASGLVPAIETVVRQRTTAPIAALAIPATAVAETPAAFNATGSSGNGDVIAGYDWDFEGDGVYDLTTADPVASHTYAAPFVGTVTVRVRAQSGLASLATGAVNVVAPATAAPPRPQGVKAKRGDGSVTLSWTMPAGAQARWITIRAHGKRLDRVAAGPDGTSQSWQGGGLVNGRRYALSVRAGNERGDGPATKPVSVVPLGVDVLSELSVSPRRFLPSDDPSGRAHGAVLSYTGTAPSHTVVAVQQRKHGKRWVTIGRLKHRELTGAVRIRLTGWIASRPLEPGPYRLRIVTRNAVGRGRAAKIPFRIKR